MKNRIVKSILSLTVAVPLMALADPDFSGASDTERIVPVKESVEESVPPSAGKLPSSVRDSETSTSIDVTTSDYGQLETLLAEKGGDSATTISVSGPIDASDFNAIWECAAKGNLRILNLSRSEIKDNIIPDYALYNTLQFEAGHWLSIR